ncbi:ANTAR domain-containing protein [Streptomyces sp. WAC05858]|nr:ANTAR domain-containing protein [Streptomyces sp. WAC05858]
MASRAVIDQAIGVAITHGSLLPDQGWGVLRTVSQTTNIKVRLIAEQIVRWPHSGRLPEDIRQVLEAALAHLRDSGPHPHAPPSGAGTGAISPAGRARWAAVNRPRDRPGFRPHRRSDACGSHRETRPRPS